MSASPTIPASRIIPFIIVLASVLMAMLFGLISVTTSPILVSFAVALVAGTILLARPVWIMWLVLSLGLLVTGLLPLYVDAAAGKAAWGVSLLGFTLMFLAFLKVATSPDARKDTPAFVWAALGFLVYALLNSLIQWHSVGEFSGGFKRYFHMWGILFALCWLVFDEQDIRRWRVFFVIVALVQLPFAIYEVIVFVPLREGLRNSFPGMVPIDVVGGTFGASLTGGGASAEMATFLIIVLAFLLARWMEKMLSTGRLILLTFLVLAPLFLGETKAVVIMLPLMFLVLFRHQMLVQLHYWLMGLIVVALLVVVASYAYLHNISTQKTMAEKIEDTLDYNIYERGSSHLYYLNRTTALTFWVERQGVHDPVSFVFGNGLGSSHTNTGGHMAMRYPWHGIGLTAASTLLWDLGVFGFGLFIAILALAWRSAGRLRRESTLPTVRADAAAIQAALALLAFYLFYRIGVLQTLSFQIVFAVLLGYLAWLHRRHVVAIANNHS
ncbi:MAG: hypothetical protein Q8K59_10510 [Nitrosomonas sp.]|nr:hypothetical protein [Nitrosomonas sp.]MDP1951503.1 hypothetical protein [Nitrosomonas sp.]